MAAYYSEDGCKALHSFKDFNFMHPLFNNLPLRERLSDNMEQPLTVLVPHYLDSFVDFEQISNFFLRTTITLPQASSSSFAELFKRINTGKKSKHLYLMSSSKFVLSHIQSHRLTLATKSDRVKLESYLQHKELIRS
jgi:hypothetical protein